MERILLGIARAGGESELPLDNLDKSENIRTDYCSGTRNTSCSIDLSQEISGMRTNRSIGDDSDRDYS